MNIKLVVLGGLAYFLVSFVLGFATGPLLHGPEGVLYDAYVATSQFWRPELMQDPPDMAALMPRWIVAGLIGGFIVAGIYGVVRSSFVGPGWKRGLKYGFALFLLTASWMLSYAGIFNLPDMIWAWWCGENLIYCLVGGAVLGWVGDLKFVGGEIAVRAPA